MRRFTPAFLISCLLHAGLVLLFLFSWKTEDTLKAVPSVPVEIVSKVPSRAMAEAPVDELAVKTPAPVPAPPEPIKKVEPVPAPPLPVPVPQKEVAKPQPKLPVKTPAPTPVKPTPAPPDKNGLKKPVPQKPAKPSLDLDALSQIAANPSKSPTRTRAQASTHRTTGISVAGAAANDAGIKKALDDLKSRIDWRLYNCDVPGVRDQVPQITFKLSSAGRVIEGPNWINRQGDSIAQAVANSAMAAINKNQPYAGLPDELYNKTITSDFDANTACNRR